MILIDPEEREEIQHAINELKSQIRAERDTLNELESLCCIGTNHNDIHEYGCPAWFK